MKRLLLYILLPVLAAGIFFGCENLEDTYSDYTGDGPIRYLAKCVNLEANAKWESVELSWENNQDLERDSIYIVWQDDSSTRDTLVDKNSTSCVIENLENFDYFFSVSSVSFDEENNMDGQSLETTIYARPFSLEHESLSTFTQVVIKQFKVGDDNLFLFFDNWKDNLLTAEIGYYKIGETDETRLQLEKVNLGTETAPDFWPNGQKELLLENVDFAKDIIIYRTGSVDQIEDPDFQVVFPDIKLNLNVLVFNSDFAAQVQDYLNVSQLTASTIADVEVLEFDQNIASMEDILYFPNLKEVYFGKNRYMTSTYAYYASEQSVLSEKERSLAALNIAHDKLQLDVHQYNSHYFASYEAPVWFIKEGNPVIPEVNLLENTASWSYTVTPADEAGYDSQLANLFDNQANTDWTPLRISSIRVHAIEIDMKEDVDIRGFKIVQSSSLGYYSMLIPNMIEIEIASDGGEWRRATYQEEVPIGDSQGETTIVYLDKDKQTQKARRIRFYVTDKDYYSSSYGTALADFMVIQ
ncbi:DUF4998 domain-containing protein [Plebeiibacterium sediminum]|uniref:DUF4998 domain-containing protein n=1 Tax=Plebeiibacterium sediminum TaxID=2992112 RepID=A0AAE3M4E9_9BACT|nr:DUF4998 domain-containing protein [Plebeiobacterium sediminum]MCW3786816.1 DUF4998 domain-containing protein [Plebeiobacterium sediminum]